MLTVMSLTAMMIVSPIAIREPATWEESLVELAQSFETPARLDQTTTMLSVRASGLVLTYHLRLDERATEAQMRTFFATRRAPGLCADEDARFTFSQGITFRYSYVTLIEQTPIIIDVNREYCASL